MDCTLLLDTDSYKASHWLQYPGDLTAMGAYLESRGGEHSETLFFGLQMLLQTRLLRPITLADVAEAAELWALHGLPFRVVGVSVSRPPGEIESAMRSMAGAVLGRVGADPARMDSVDVVLVDRRHAPEASVAQAAARDLACRGLIVDGHYGLPSWLVAEELAGPDRPVIFWHTGGTAGVPHLLAEIQGESHG